MMDGYVGGADDVMKIARYNKKREQEKEKFEVPKPLVVLLLYLQINYNEEHCIAVFLTTICVFNHILMFFT